MVNDETNPKCESGTRLLARRVLVHWCVNSSASGAAEGSHTLTTTWVVGEQSASQIAKHTHQKPFSIIVVVDFYLLRELREAQRAKGAFGRECMSARKLLLCSRGGCCQEDCRRLPAQNSPSSAGAGDHHQRVQRKGRPRRPSQPQHNNSRLVNVVDAAAAAADNNTVCFECLATANPSLVNTEYSLDTLYEQGEYFMRSDFIICIRTQSLGLANDLHNAPNFVSKKF